jgi:hypothetical protein
MTAAQGGAASVQVEPCQAGGEVDSSVFSEKVKSLVMGVSVLGLSELLLTDWLRRMGPTSEEMQQAWAELEANGFTVEVGAADGEIVIRW